MENIEKIKPSGLFTNYIYKAIPLAFDESMSYYETLCGLLAYIKDVILPAINKNADAIIEIENLYNELKSYVDNYFENLDVQNEINNKLDQMVEDGTLADIINQDLFNELNEEIKSKVNITNQDSTITRLCRFITTHTNIKAIHIFNNSIYYTTNDGTNSSLYKLNKSTYEIESVANFDYIITDISNYENNIIISNGTNKIYSLDKDSLIAINNIDIPFNLKYIELDIENNIYYTVDTSYNFRKTEDFINYVGMDFNKNCNGIVIKNQELYLLQNNTVELIVDNNVKRIYNNNIVVNNAFYKGINGAICLNGDNFIIGTYKWLMVHRPDYIISFYDMNLSTNVESINKLLDYNATTNDFEIHVNTSNTNVNPDGSITNAFPNIYEAMEVALNGNYHKGSIIFDSANDVLDNVFISSLYKKVSIVFNNATINGMIVRNCTKVELAGANFKDEYEDHETCLQVVNSDVVIASNCTFENTKSLNQVLKSEYKSNVVCLVDTGNLGIYTDTGGVIITRNNSLYDKKILGDRFGKFFPNIILDNNSNLDVNTPYTITNLNYYSTIMLRINLQAKFSYQEIPALDGNYSVVASATIDNKLYIGNLGITISGDTITVTSRSLYNITDDVIDNTLTFRVNNIFLKS